MRPDIEGIKKRLKLADKGPWYVGHIDENNDLAVITNLEVDICAVERRNSEPFIAHARQDIPDLLAYIEELEAKLAATDKAFSEHMNARFGFNKATQPSPSSDETE
jgi:hypothetical protein